MSGSFSFEQKHSTVLDNFFQHLFVIAKAVIFASIFIIVFIFIFIFIFISIFISIFTFIFTSISVFVFIAVFLIILVANIKFLLRMDTSVKRMSLSSCNL